MLGRALWAGPTHRDGAAMNGAQNYGGAERNAGVSALRHAIGLLGFGRDDVAVGRDDA